MNWDSDPGTGNIVNPSFSKIANGYGIDSYDVRNSDELDNMIFNVGLEYWYTDNFALRAGYIYDEAGDVKNPTFGAK